MSRSKTGEIPQTGKELDAQVLGEGRSEETAETRNEHAINWVFILIAILFLVILGTAIAMIGQFHWYEIFAGRKT